MAAPNPSRAAAAISSADVVQVYAADVVVDISNMRRAALGMKPVYHGPEGVRQFWRESLSDFGEFNFEVHC